MAEPIIFETPVVDSSNVLIKTSSEQALIDILKIAIANKDIQTKISIKLTPDIIKLINNIISLYPKSLTDIENYIKEVIKDGKIDTKDVPKLIVVIKVLYRLIYSLKNIKLDGKKRAEVTSGSLKFIIHLLVLERKIEIPNEIQTEFLKDVDILIDNCVELLVFPKIIKTNNCLKKLLL